MRCHAGSQPQQQRAGDAVFILPNTASFLHAAARIMHSSSAPSSQWLHNTRPSLLCALQGKISREDIAELCVELLSTPAALDTTFEIKSTVRQCIDSSAILPTAQSVHISTVACTCYQHVKRLTTCRHLIIMTFDNAMEHC